VKIIITNIVNIKNCFACVPYNQTKSLLNHLKFNEFKSFTSAGHRCKQQDDTKIDRRAVVNNKKNPLCGLSRSRNAKFYLKRDFRPDPLRWSVFYCRHFCAELHGLSFTRLCSRSDFPILCEKVDFSQF
jgi:hypothetical protein